LARSCCNLMCMQKWSFQKQLQVLYTFYVVYINDRLVWNLDSFGVMFKLAPSRSSRHQDSSGDWTSGPKL
jgi:hypothetical protein